MKPIKNTPAKMALMFLGNVFLCLFFGTVVASFVDFNPLIVALVLHVASYFYKVPEGAFADVVINDTSYAGEFLDYFITQATSGFQTFTKGLLYIQAGIKKQATVGTIDVTAFIQASQDPPKFGGGSNIGARQLVPKEFMGYLEFYPRNFEAHWLAVQMNPALLDAMLPATAESAITSKIIALNEDYLDKAVWQSVYDASAIATAKASGLAAGDNNLIFFDGYIKKLSVDATVNKILTAGGAVALTAGNIVSKLDALKALILAQPNGAKVYYDPNFKIMMNFKSKSLYADAQKAQTYKGVDFTSGGNDVYDGHQIVPIQGMPDNTIVGGIATRDLNSNFWMGVNEVDEETYLKLKPLQNNSEKWFFKMLYKIDVNYAFGSQTFMYTTLY